MGNNTQERYQVIARKYRPKRFGEVFGQEAVVTTLKNAIRFGKVANGYLFTGSRGVGKTSLARIFAKALNCRELRDEEPCNKCPSCLEINAGQSLDVIEIDGASNRGIDDVRRINETIGYGCVAPDGPFIALHLRRGGTVRLVIKFSLARIGARSPRCG